MNLAENYPIEMRSLLKRMIELYGKADAKTIAEALPDSYVGKVFMPKGTVATVADLPDEDNEIGDMYHVTEDEGEYAWWPTTEYPDGHWEFMGSVSGGDSDLFIVVVDDGATPITADKTYAEVQAAITAGKTVVYIGTGWQATTIQPTSNAVYAYGIVLAANGPVLVILFHTSSSLTITQVPLQEAPITVTVTGSTPTITAEDNHIYECGECSSLTVSSFPASGKFWIWFTSGPTATTMTGINNGDGTPFAPETNKLYKITVENGYATFDAWSVGGGS